MDNSEIEWIWQSQEYIIHLILHIIFYYHNARAFHINWNCWRSIRWQCRTWLLDSRFSLMIISLLSYLLCDEWEYLTLYVHPYYETTTLIIIMTEGLLVITDFPMLLFIYNDRMNFRLYKMTLAKTKMTKSFTNVYLISERNIKLNMDYHFHNVIMDYR